MTSWWHRSVGYEVYLRSFADGDGDGDGDLIGLRARLAYLAWLGVDLLWITPFYPSPLADHGYDVADYRDVDARYGGLDALDALLDEARELGMRVIVDLVPNHSSSEHPWFREARTARDSRYRDCYIWRDPAPGGGPPNNWAAVFGGPAWAYDEATGQYWLHLFLPEQPDWNWRNPEVVDEFDDVLAFWLARGVDGFRIDVAHALAKHPDLPDNPPADAPDEAEFGAVSADWERLEHRYDVDQPDVVDIYRRWRPIAEAFDALLLGEVYLLDPAEIARYVGGQDGLHMAFWFEPLHMSWDADALRRSLRRAVQSAAPRLAWVAETHGRPRAPTRLGGGEPGRDRALALTTLLFGLPGLPFLYQGQELGLCDGEVPREAAQDPIAVRHGDYASSRDGCRTPMPWAPGHCRGFTDAPRPWLPVDDRRDGDTVAVQRAAPDAVVHRYRRLVRLRRDTPDLHDQPLEWCTADGDPVVAYRRGGVLVAANCGDRAAEIDLGEVGEWRVAFTTDRLREGQRLSGLVGLGAAEAVVVQR